MNAKEVIGGRYEIRRSLGRGGMAQVFLAWDLTLQREVAIKALRPDLLADPYEVSRFLIEGQTMARIESDHVVEIFDVHSSNKGTYIVMERVIGQTIEDIVVSKGQVPLFDALQAARDVLLALADLHEQGLIHRDIKPANVLVGDDGKTKLLDLGVAFDQRSPGFTLPHHTCGTPGYMSPEQRATGHVDARSDLYQLGLLLVYALTGSEAVAGRATTEVLSRVPTEIAPIIHKVLSDDPSARYQSAGEMLAEIQVFCNGARTVEIGVVDPREIAAYEAKIARASLKQPRIAVISSASISLAMPKPRSSAPKLAAIGAAFGLALVGVFAAFHSSSDAVAMPAKQAAVAKKAPAAGAAPAPTAVAAAPAAKIAPPPAKAVAPVKAPEPRIVTEARAASAEPRIIAAVAVPAPAPRVMPDRYEAPVTSPAQVQPKATHAEKAMAREFANATTGTVHAPGTEMATPAPKEAAPTPAHTAPSGDDGSGVLAQAQVAERNGSKEMAIATYRRYLRKYPDAPGAASVRSHLTALESGRN